MPEVLVVEDTETMRHFLAKAIGAMGATAHLAVGVEDARARLGEREYDAALLDHYLPDGDGIELARLVRERSPATEVLIVTGDPAIESAIAAMRSGAVDYLPKPLTLGLVQHRLNMALERRRLRSQAAQVEQMLLRSERMAMLGLLSASVAHEIANPALYLGLNLEAIVGDITRMQRASLGATNPAVVEGLESIAKKLSSARLGMSRINSILHDVKSFARGEDVVGVVDLHEVVQSVLQMAGGELRRHAAVESDLQAVPPVRASRVRLEQVLLNLLINASQALGEGGGHRITVTAFTDSLGQAAVEIRDTGKGMDLSTRDNLFKPFFTTKPVGEGTGLGLSVCHQIVTSLGGAIAVQSEVGKGTAFTVTLPAAAVSTTIAIVR
jgi:signal transduction histidine kinase